MSDDNKNFNDDLDDMIGDAKEGARRAGDKISSSAKEFSEDAKEFGRDAKESAKEFADDAKEVLSDGKNVAIIAHITLIGLIIAFVMNSGAKTEYGTFYIRQMLGICIVGIVIGILSMIIPVLGILSLITVVLWVMSLIGSLSGEKKPLPVIGDHFQEWFKGI